MICIANKRDPVLFLLTVKFRKSIHLDW